MQSLTLSFPRLLILLLACFAVTLPAGAQLNSAEQQLFNLLANASGQNRPTAEVNPTLSRVARARAKDMADRDYFSHTNPDGKGANALVRAAGYPLPSNYDQSASGNNIESIAAGYETAKIVWNGWMGSSGHKRHLLAETSFYAAQTEIGVGYYFDSGSEYGHYWVVLSAPPAGPTLAIKTPAANASFTEPGITVSGSAGGAPAANRVVVRLENSAGTGDFRNASGTTSWSLAISNLAPGINTVRIRSLDAAGATIKEETRSFRYALPAPLTVQVQGSGSVTKGFLGTTQRDLGVSYTVTAKAAVGSIFERWSGSVQSTSAALTFTMQSGFAVTAHFRENPFYAQRGAYNGLVQAPSAAHATSGFFKVNATATGTFSGQLTLGGKGYKFAGAFDPAGAAQVAIKRGALPPLVLNLRLDLSGGTDVISGSVTDGAFTAALAADQAVVSDTPHFAAGRYTVRLPATNTAAPETIPPGDGFALLTVSKTGAAKISGTLADGRAFTSSATVSKAGRLPIYAALLGGTGSLAGNAIIGGHAAVLTGSALWTKPQRDDDRYFPDPFATTIRISGSRYVAPAAGVPALTVATADSNSTLALTAGDLDNTVQPATLLATDRVTIAAPQLPKLTLNIARKTGRLTGSFVHPATGALSRIAGVVLQSENAAHGFFLGESEGGAASFAPAY